MRPERAVALTAGAALIAGAAALSLSLDEPLVKPTSAAPMTLGPPMSAPLGALSKTQHWLNTKPLQPEDLQGKVVLVNFWTLTCVNWLRTLPYVRAWAHKYKDRGLVVVGVHTPEFSFEKDFANVKTAAAALGVDYPVATDNDFAIWRAFDNYAWPAFFFVDANGRLRHRMFGEGGYDRSERTIQQLVSETAGPPVSRDLVTVSPRGTEVSADEETLGSPETYVGYAKAENFASPDRVRKDAPVLYRTPERLPLNSWSATGTWTFAGEFATLDKAPGSISYRFHARDVNFVLTPPAPGQTVRFRVTIDGKPPGADHGTDVDADGMGSVQDSRLYQLVRQKRPIEDRTFEIEFLDPGVRAYSFTFG